MQQKAVTYQCLQLLKSPERCLLLQTESEREQKATTVNISKPRAGITWGQQLTGDHLPKLRGRDGKLVRESPQARLPGGAVELVVRSSCPPRTPPVAVAAAAVAGGVTNLLVRLS